ncbi:MAG: DUF6443 domain-containing protein, partial [Flavobacteriales bacterium]
MKNKHTRTYLQFSFPALRILFLSLLLSTGAFAQIEYTAYISKSGIVPGAYALVNDVNTSVSGSGIWVKRTPFVRLEHTRKGLTDLQSGTGWWYQVVYKLMNPADTTKFLTDTLVISYNDSTFVPKSAHVYENCNWIGVAFRVISVCGKTAGDPNCVISPQTYPLLPSDIEIIPGFMRKELRSFPGWTGGMAGGSSSFSHPVFDCDSLFDVAADSLDLDFQDKRTNHKDQIRKEFDMPEPTAMYAARVALYGNQYDLLTDALYTEADLVYMQANDITAPAAYESMLQEVLAGPFRTYVQQHLQELDFRFAREYYTHPDFEENGRALHRQFLFDALAGKYLYYTEEYIYEKLPADAFLFSEAFTKMIAENRGARLYALSEWIEAVTALDYAYFQDEATSFEAFVAYLNTYSVTVEELNASYPAAVQELYLRFAEKCNYISHYQPLRIETQAEQLLFALDARRDSIITDETDTLFAAGFQYAEKNTGFLLTGRNEAKDRYHDEELNMYIAGECNLDPEQEARLLRELQKTDERYYRMQGNLIKAIYEAVASEGPAVYDEPAVKNIIDEVRDNYPVEQAELPVATLKRNIIAAYKGESFADNFVTDLNTYYNLRTSSFRQLFKEDVSNTDQTEGPGFAYALWAYSRMKPMLEGVQAAYGEERSELMNTLLWDVPGLQHIRIENSYKEELNGYETKRTEQQACAAQISSLQANTYFETGIPLSSANSLKNSELDAVYFAVEAARTHIHNLFDSLATDCLSPLAQSRADSLYDSLSILYFEDQVLADRILEARDRFSPLTAGSAAWTDFLDALALSGSGIVSEMAAMPGRAFNGLLGDTSAIDSSCYGTFSTALASVETDAVTIFNQTLLSVLYDYAGYYPAGIDDYVNALYVYTRFIPAYEAECSKLNDAAAAEGRLLSLSLPLLHGGSEVPGVGISESYNSGLRLSNLQNKKAAVPASNKTLAAPLLETILQNVNTDAGDEVRGTWLAEPFWMQTQAHQYLSARIDTLIIETGDSTLAEWKSEIQNLYPDLFNNALAALNDAYLLGPDELEQPSPARIQDFMAYNLTGTLMQQYHDVLKSFLSGKVDEYTMRFGRQEDEVYSIVDNFDLYTTLDAYQGQCIEKMHVYDDGISIEQHRMYWNASALLFLSRAALSLRDVQAGILMETALTEGRNREISLFGMEGYTSPAPKKANLGASAFTGYASINISAAVPDFSYTYPTPQIVTQAGPSGCGNIRYVTWNTITGATEYDLEWVYIDNKIYVNGQQANTLSDISYRAFQLAEPVRITTKETKFPIQEEYPDGKLYFRVRSVARIIDNTNQDYTQAQFFPWIGNFTGYPVTSATVFFSNPAGISGANSNNNFNWQWECTYAEEAKYKKVISYHDGLNRPVQVLTHMSSDNTTIVGETLYDHEGRPAVSLLPYPEKCRQLAYKPGRHLDVNSTVFNKVDFETDHITTKYLSGSIGVARYYSANNDFLALDNGTYQYEGLPDAAGYVYSRTVFMPDATGRLISTSGVGELYKTGSGRETRYFYANATSTELQRLFGRNVGNASHYKKNVVVDANGQISIAYVDQSDRTIATALGGEAPENVKALTGSPTANNSSKYDPQNITVNLMGNNVYDPVTHTSEISYNHLNDMPGNSVSFSYQYTEDIQEFANLGICIFCEYDLEIVVTGPGNVPVPLTMGGTTYNNGVLTRRIAPGGPGTPACTTQAQQTMDFTAYFDEVGVYKISKRLVWDKEAAYQNLRNAMHPGNNTLSEKTLQDLVNAEVNAIDYTDCDPGPDLEDLGDKEQAAVLLEAANTRCDAMYIQMLQQIRPAPAGITGADPAIGFGKVYETAGFWAEVKLLRIAGQSNPASGTLNISPYVIPPTISTEAIRAMDSWPEEWERELVKAHPEYCWYEHCLSWQNREGLFDLRMSQVENHTEAKNLGWMNPQDHTAAQTGVGSTHLGPYFSSGNQEDEPYTSIKNDMLHQQDAYGADQTLWYLAIQSYSQPVLSAADQNRAAWQIFRGSYLMLKENAYYDERPSGCDYSSDAWAIVKKPDELDGIGEDEMEAANNSNSQFFNNNGAYCTQLAENNARLWADQLISGCIADKDEMSTAQQTAYGTMLDRFEQYSLSYCGGYNATNPLGMILEADLTAALGAGTVSAPVTYLREAMTQYNTYFAGNGACESVTTGNYNTTFPVSADTNFYTQTCTELPFCGLSSTEGIRTFLQGWSSFLFNRGPISETQTYTVNGTAQCAGFSIQMPETTFDWACCQESCEGGICTAGASDCSQNCYETRETCALILPQGVTTGSCAGCGIEFRDLADNLIPMHKVRSFYMQPFFQVAQQANGDYRVLTTFVSNKLSYDAVNAEITFSNLGASVNFGYIVIKTSACPRESLCVATPQLPEPDTTDDCYENLQEMAQAAGQAQFDAWFDQQLSFLMENLNCRATENFNMTYLKSEHHYTLYYYDQAGNLVMTVPPQGVNPLASTAFNSDGTWKGSNVTVNWTYEPNHTMESRYKFNSLNVAIETETPDGGFTELYPDDLGRPVRSINSAQRNRTQTAGSVVTRYESYTEYDNLSRVTEVGEKKLTYTSGTLTNTYKQEITRTIYDVQISFPNNNYNFVAENTRFRVAQVQYRANEAALNYQHSISYSYDIHGNVKTVLEDVPALAPFGQRYTKTDYYYDLLSGKVNEVHYQKGRYDQYFYRYTYDADNRLTVAESSPNGYLYDKDARYYYFAHGPLMRTETGEEKVQGSDYTYTLQGWLKAVNAGAINPEYDPGRDGLHTLAGNNNVLSGRDAYGFVLDYNNSDYTAIQPVNVKFSPVIAGTAYGNYALQHQAAGSPRGMFNGNIVRMTTAHMSIQEAPMAVLGNAYQYDQLNRITEHRTYEKSNMHASGQYTFSGVSQTLKYGSNYTYDANGNIITFKRYNKNAQLSDDMSYWYKTVSSLVTGFNYNGPQNQLDHVGDAISSSAFSDDLIDTQGSNNYMYDG